MNWYTYSAIPDLQSLERYNKKSYKLEFIENTWAVGLQHKESARGQAFQC